MFSSESISRSPDGEEGTRSSSSPTRESGALGELLIEVRREKKLLIPGALVLGLLPLIIAAMVGFLLAFFGDQKYFWQSLLSSLATFSLVLGILWLVYHARCQACLAIYENGVRLTKWLRRPVVITRDELKGFALKAPQVSAEGNVDVEGLLRIVAAPPGRRQIKWPYRDEQEIDEAAASLSQWVLTRIARDFRDLGRARWNDWIWFTPAGLLVFRKFFLRRGEAVLMPYDRLQVEDHAKGGSLVTFEGEQERKPSRSWSIRLREKQENYQPGIVALLNFSSIARSSALDQGTSATPFPSWLSPPSLDESVGGLAHGRQPIDQFWSRWGVEAPPRWDRPRLAVESLVSAVLIGVGLWFAVKGWRAGEPWSEAGGWRVLSVLLPTLLACWFTLRAIARADYRGRCLARVAIPGLVALICWLMVPNLAGHSGAWAWSESRTAARQLHSLPPTDLDGFLAGSSLRAQLMLEYPGLRRPWNEAEQDWVKRLVEESESSLRRWRVQPNVEEVQVVLQRLRLAGTAWTEHHGHGQTPVDFPSRRREVYLAWREHVKQRIRQAIEQDDYSTAVSISHAFSQDPTARAEATDQGLLESLDHLEASVVFLDRLAKQAKGTASATNGK